MRIYSVNKHKLQLRIFLFCQTHHTCRKYLLEKSQYCNKNYNALNIFFRVNIFQVQLAKTNFRWTQAYFLCHQFHRHMRIMFNSRREAKDKPAMLSVFPAEKFWSICKFIVFNNQQKWVEPSMFSYSPGWPWLKQTRDKKEERDWLEVSRLWPTQYSFERDTWYGLVGKSVWQCEAKDWPEHRTVSDQKHCQCNSVLQAIS